ncbi:MAG: hypothetical protein Q8N09_11850 [Thermodesulfovibrionia bacterium]|nr:hypothetical protein [Thermodesulfovibrionia bacterium]
MDMNSSELDIVINLIDFEKSCIKSAFEDFSGVLVLNSKNHSCRSIFSGVMTIADALWDIETTIYRLEWQKQLYFHNEISFDQWFIFSAADIRLFHIEIRSLMDHIGLVIKHAAQSKNKPKDSFDDLRKKRDHYLQRNMISREVYDLLDSSDWFDRFRAIRGAIVHEGAQVISFGIKKGDPVLWNIYKQDYKSLLTDSKFVINENGVMNFERYAAYHMYHIYSFLDKFGDFLYQVTGITRSQKGIATRSHGGIQVLQTWMKELRNFLQSS